MSTAEDILTPVLENLTWDQLQYLLSYVSTQIHERLSALHTEDRGMPSSPTATAHRGKSNAKRNEEKDVDQILVLLNDPASVMGAQMRKRFHSLMGMSILEARRGVGGGNAAHYDFEVRTETGWHKVEHKGSVKKAPIKTDSNPWENGVQFHNGGAKFYTLSRKYAASWYAKYIETGLLRERYSLTSPLPSFDEWYRKDALAHGDPKTAFGIELKAVYRRDHPGKSLEQERNEFVAEFITTCTEEDRQVFAEEVLPVIQEAFRNKDVWLQVAGDVYSDEFYFHWSPSLSVNRIQSVTILKKSDIELVVECDNGLVLHPILRWGKGMGFSNLRVDLK